MTFESWHYTVTAEVTFAKEEYEALIELAKTHYDAVCWEAGMRGGETGKFGTAAKNGFLAQLAMFPTTEEATTVVWPFRHFDIVMKILEMWTYCPSLRQYGNVYRTLEEQIYALLGRLSAEHNRLNN